MNGNELRGLRERLGFNQQQLAEYLNEVTGRSYKGSTVSTWESDKRTIPAVVAELREIGIDTAPEGDASEQTAQAPMSSSGIYTRACVDLWGMIAMIVSSAGALSKSAALMQDGFTIDADKQALGRAWGKLAESNETFRKMLVSATSGGAYLEVILVTSTTAGKLFQNHHARRPIETENADHRASVENQTTGG
jgi:hypothetical protein